jgi:toxin ParE1/3/4
VGKIVTRRYPYLVYYSVDEEASEVIVVAIKHPARKREYTDL